MKTDLPLADTGSVNALRYQPIPPGNAPPPKPAGFFSSNSPSMLQSCGRFKARHFESSRSGVCPLVTSPSLNRQSLPKLIVLSGLTFANAFEFQNTSTLTVIIQDVVRLFILVYPLTVECHVGRAKSGLVDVLERNV